MIKTLCIATFSLTQAGKRTAINGMIEPLLAYFLPKGIQIDLIDGPHPGSSEVITKFEYYTHGKLRISNYAWSAKILSPLLWLQNSGGTRILFKIRDVFSVFELCLRRRIKYDLFIGLESIYTLCGIILKKIGATKIVVYYVSDYSPKRYENKLLNHIYLWLDRICCYSADYIWDVSPAMLPARINAGLEKTKCKPVIVVPNALFAKQISALPVRKLHKNSLVFAGTFGRENGSVLAIEAMREVVKVIPDATLHFFGGNKEQEDYLKSISSTYRLNEHVFFHGFVKDATILARDIKTYMIGLAPYVALKGSPRFYADATKIRLYLGCGLPVITTHVPPLGREIAKIGAAIVVRDNAKEIAKAVINLLNNSKQYNKMRSKAIAYAKNNTWEKTYDKALSAMNLSFT